MDFLTSLLGRNGYLPHGYCFAWKPALLWSMVGADTLIALAYFSIPLALITFARRRKGPYVRRLVTLFSAFIFACGLTHVVDVWAIWQPDYNLQALTKVITAAISVGTAIVLWRLIPQALKIPSVSQLQEAITGLEAEVAQRRMAEAHLADTQEALLITLASIGGGFLATDHEGRVTRMNAVAEQITGWTQAQAMGQSLWRVFQREGRPEADLASNPVDVMIRSGATIDKAHQVVAISRTGQRTAVEVKASLTYAPDGGVRGLAMVFRDMSAINAAQAQVHEMAAIVESSTDAIIGKTLQGRITSWNQGAQALFGYTADEAIGQPIQMLLPPDREHEEMRILAQLASGERVAPFETIRRRKDGSLVPVSVTISPITDAQGRVLGASKIARDISMQKQAEQLRIKGQQLEAENRQILEASRLKSEFLANMSHELRTPLNAIIGFADLLHSGAVPASSPKHQTFLGHIGTSGRHLLQLINDVLDLSKVESGKLSFHPEPVHLPTLAHEVCDILQATASRSGVRMLTQIDPQVADLTLDAARLKQVLYNYLSNAIKFTPSGGQVTLRALPEGDSRVRIEVEDTGIGIAPADLSRLFVEFQQLDSSMAKQHAGTGLGLALTRRLVQAQGGSVGVHSTPGQGSVFHVVLDRVCRPVAPPDEAPPDAQPDGPGTTATRAPRRVLVIDDNAQDRARIQDALVLAGFSADTAQNAHEALARASAQPYDALTLGLVLPDRSGLELLSSIRSAGPSRDAPVVAVSMVAEQGLGARFPITDVLAKPIDAQQVVAALSKIRPPAGRMATRVMVIDDDPLALTLMSDTLTPAGLHTICMDDGRRALREIAVHRPDAIILDLMMPDFDGFSVLDSLLQMPEWRHTPVFIWTSMLLSDDEYAMLAQSARAILNKGGGALQTLLDDLRRRRPSPAHTPEAAPGNATAGSAP